MTARRASVSALAVTLLAAGTWAGAVPSGSAAVAAAADATVVDAGKNAQQAADLINEACADVEKCEWKSTGDYATKYGPIKVIGDVLYNCSVDGPDEEEAETAVGVTDERGETTSLSEEVSLEISAGFLGLEKTALKASVFAKQAQGFSNEVEVVTSTTVPAGYKGFNAAALLSANITGSVYLNDGPDSYVVQNIDMSIPGYRGIDAKPVWTNAAYSGTAVAMTADEIAAHCPFTVPDSVGKDPRSDARASLAAARLERERFRITVCRPHGSTRDRGCVRMRVSGLQAPPHRDKVTATLTRAGQVYARERNRRGAVRLVQTRTITPGEYTLTLKEKPEKIVVRRSRDGKFLHRATHTDYVVVPLRISRTRKD